MGSLADELEGAYASSCSTNGTNQRPEITVNTAEAKAATNPEKMLTLSAGGTPPDIYYGAFGTVAGLFVAGATVDVDAELKGIATGVNSAPTTSLTCSHPAVERQVVAILASPGPRNRLERRSAPARRRCPTQAELDLERLRGMAERFIRPDVIPFSVNWDDWDHFLGTTGSRPVSKDGRKVTIDTPEMLATMEFMVGVYSRGIAQMTPDGKSVAEQYRLAKNDTVFELQGAYRFPVYKTQNAPAWGAIHIPIRPQGGQIFGFAGGHSVAVANVAPDKKRWSQ